MNRLAIFFTSALCTASISAAAIEAPVGQPSIQTGTDLVNEKDDSTRFMVTCDSRGSSNGVNSAILAEIVQATLEENVDFILFPGDLVTGSSDSTILESELLQWRSIMQPVYDAGIGVYPCRGNHDADNKAVWDNVFSGPYALPDNGPSGEDNITFSFTHNNIFVVGLDLYTQTHRINQAWLDKQLAANMQPHVFVFAHEPAFKVRHRDCLDDYPDDRNTFWNSVAAEGGRTYFCGHDHFYDHARLNDGDGDPSNDLHQLVVGVAGAPLVSDASYNGNNGSWTPQRLWHDHEIGYVLVEIDGFSVTMTWKHRIAEGVYKATGDVWTYMVSENSCCVGVRGNIDGDQSDKLDSADVTYLVDYLFLGGPPPPCPEEGNIDGIMYAGGPIDVADLTYLVAYLFHGSPAPPPCP